VDHRDRATLGSEALTPQAALVVERTLAWLNRNRRLAKDFEASIESAVAWLLITNIKLLTRRVAKV
jgi:transposase